MKNTFIIQLLRVLTPEEQPKLRKFLQSPYFNKRQELIDLYEILLNYRKSNYNSIEKESVFQQVFPERPFNNLVFNHLLSDLCTLVERFFSLEEIQSDENLLRLRACRALRKRGAAQLFERDIAQLSEGQALRPYRNATYFLNQYEVITEQYSAAALQSRQVHGLATAASEALSNFFMMENLRWACTLQALKSAAAPSDLPEAALTEAVLRESAHTEHAALALLRQCLLTLRNVHDETQYEQLRQAIDASVHLLPPAEARDVYMSAINFAIRRHNQGDPKYTHEAFELYRRALESGVLADTGHLAKYTFINIFNLAQLAGASEWARHFIDAYCGLLPSDDRKNIHQYCLAGYYFRQKNYPQVLELLHEVAFTEVFISLDVRKMMLRSYYELGEWLVLSSLLDSFRAYLRRHRQLGYHRESYLNLIKYTQKLVMLKKPSTTQKRRLLEQIKAEQWLTEREWLQMQLEAKQP